MQIDRDSTEYLFIGVSGTVPSVSAEVAFMATPPGSRPTSGDWKSATIVPNSGHALWADAVASGATGDYYIARLVGAFGGNTVTLTGGTDYTVWLRLTGATEQAVRIAPDSVECL